MEPQQVDLAVLRQRFDAAPPGALIPAPEVAAALGLTVDTLTVYRATGKGPRYLKVGARRVMYRKRDVLDWMKQNVREPGARPPKGKRPADALLA